MRGGGGRTAEAGVCVGCVGADDFVVAGQNITTGDARLGLWASLSGIATDDLVIAG